MQRPPQLLRRTYLVIGYESRLYVLVSPISPTETIAGVSARKWFLLATVRSSVIVCVHVRASKRDSLTWNGYGPCDYPWPFV